jgi:hypothetical protein
MEKDYLDFSTIINKQGNKTIYIKDFQFNETQPNIDLHLKDL